MPDKFDERTSSLTQPSPQGEGFHAPSPCEMSSDGRGSGVDAKTKICEVMSSPWGEETGEGVRSTNCSFYFFDTAHNFINSPKR